MCGSGYRETTPTNRLGSPIPPSWSSSHWPFGHNKELVYSIYLVVEIMQKNVILKIEWVRDHGMTAPTKLQHVMEDGMRVMSYFFTLVLDSI